MTLFAGLATSADGRILRLRRAADAIGVCATVIWILSDIVLSNLFGKDRFPIPNDYILIYQYSRDIVRTHAYPTLPYPYPPASVVLQYFLALPAYRVSAALWLVLTAAAAIGCWWILVKMLRLDARPGALAVLPLAYGFSSYFFHWDLSRQNSNVVFLAATLLGVYFLHKGFLHKGRSVPAGFWIAMGISIKLFPFLLAPYLAWKRKFRALAWTLVFLGVLWLAMPAAVLGVGGAEEVYRGWFGQLHQAAASSVTRPHPVLISLARGAGHLFPSAPLEAALVVNAFRAAWLALVLLALLPAENRRENSSAFALLSDTGLLLLAPVALSPYLEPYHPVAAAIPGLLLLAAAADPDRAGRVRVLAAIAFAAALLLLAIPSPWEIRGLMVNGKLLVACAGTVAITWIANRSKSRGAVNGTGAATGEQFDLSNP